MPLDEETGQEVERVEYPCGNRDEDDIVDEGPQIKLLDKGGRLNLYSNDNSTYLV